MDFTTQHVVHTHIIVIRCIFIDRCGKMFQTGLMREQISISNDAIASSGMTYRAKCTKVKIDHKSKASKREGNKKRNNNNKSKEEREKY